jgi:hypothetical protein
VAGFYDEFQDARERALNNWIRNFVLPYGSAYNTAHTDFFTTIDAQKKADDAERQFYVGLAMFALSFAGGSLLTAVFGTAVVKTVVAEAAVDVICKNEWEKAFKLADFVSRNKTAQFALGALWDQAGSALSDKAKAALTETPDNFPSLAQFAQKPLNLQNHLEKWARDVYDRVLTAGNDVVKQHGDVKPAGVALLKQLMASPFFQFAPLSAIDEDRTANEIELSFFMKYVMGLDYLETGYIREVGDRGWRKVVTSRKPIDVSPSDPNYPKFKSEGFDAYQEVGYTQAGGIIKKKIDELNKPVFGQTFFKQVPGWFGSSSAEEVSASVILHAYTNLGTLGQRNRQKMALKQLTRAG